jgi:hypothetical protein
LELRWFFFTIAHCFSTRGRFLIVVTGAPAAAASVLQRLASRLHRDYFSRSGCVSPAFPRVPRTASSLSLSTCRLLRPVGYPTSCSGWSLSHGFYRAPRCAVATDPVLAGNRLHSDHSPPTLVFLVEFPDGIPSRLLWPALADTGLWLRWTAEVPWRHAPSAPHPPTRIESCSLRTFRPLPDIPLFDRKREVDGGAALLLCCRQVPLNKAPLTNTDRHLNKRPSSRTSAASAGA